MSLEFLKSQTARWSTTFTGPQGGAMLPSPHRYKLAIQQQLHTNWCWAAVASSMSNFYNLSLTQCAIASVVLKANCCVPQLPEVYNQPSRLEPPLEAGGMSVEWARGHLTFSDSKVALQKGPLCCRIEWPLNGGGHFVILSGWTVARDGTEYVTVCDPWNATILDVAYQSFLSDYQAAGGSWSDHYFSSLPGVAALDVVADISLTTPPKQIARLWSKSESPPAP